jgi:hypothetical protein
MLGGQMVMRSGSVPLGRIVALPSVVITGLFCLFMTASALVRRYAPQDVDDIRTMLPDPTV